MRSTPGEQGQDSRGRRATELSAYRTCPPAQVLLDLGDAIACEGWLEGARPADVAHLLWSFSEDRQVWTQATTHVRACRVLQRFIRVLAERPEK